MTKLKKTYHFVIVTFPRIILQYDIHAVSDGPAVVEIMVWDRPVILFHRQYESGHGHNVEFRQIEQFIEHCYNSFAFIELVELIRV